MAPPQIKFDMPAPFIDQVRACELQPDDLLVPVCIHDGYGNLVGGPTNNPLPVSIVGGSSINISVGTINTDLGDGYGNPIGSQGGSLDVFVTNTVPITGSVSISNFPASQTIDDGGGSITVDGYIDSRLNDGYNNPIGSVAGALNVNVVNEPTESPDSYTNDGYGNPIGSSAGALNVNIINSFVPLSAGTGNFYRDKSSAPLAVAPSFTSFSFGFVSRGIILSNDGGTLKGSDVIEFSFDNFATVHGAALKGDRLTMDSLRRDSIQMRSASSSAPYRLIVWG